MIKRKGQVIFNDFEKYSGLKKAVDLGSKKVIDEIKDSSLKGRGGAGFPTGLKWGFVKDSKADEKFVICNADEGEPGTFKDRVLLTEYPELLFEGMVIAGLSINASKGFLYLRGEYISFKPGLQKVLDNMRKQGVLGNNILNKKGFNFDIEIKLGSGAYVCGEETALIESMEGQRGEPRNRPPFPVDTGYTCFPTIVNNVETFCTVPHIITKGADWFKTIGTEKSKGTKLISVSGDCKKPGVYEVPFGITVKEILKLVEAVDTKAVQVGGAAGQLVPKKEFNRKIAYEDISTGGSIIIFNSKRNVLDIVKNFLLFFEEESCGQCTPCREGIPVLINGLEQLKNGKCSQRYLSSLLSLAESLQLASKCGLGQSSPNAFISLINNFKDEYSTSTQSKKKLHLFKLS